MILPPACQFVQDRGISLDIERCYNSDSISAIRLIMTDSTFDLQAVLNGAPVQCREPYFTPTIEPVTSPNSPYAFSGRVSCGNGTVMMLWNSDGTAVRQSRVIFADYSDRDFDLVLAK
jgi:hypothetical protein